MTPHGARVVLVALAATAVTVGCGGPPAPARTVSLRMRGGPPEATVTIDDIFVGRLDLVAARGVALPPGPHRITVEAAGFFPSDRVVEAKDAPVRVDVALVPIPD